MSHSMYLQSAHFFRSQCMSVIGINIQNRQEAPTPDIKRLHSYQPRKFMQQLKTKQRTSASRMGANL